MTTTVWHLIGDIGGTNARFGFVRGDASDFELIANYPVADYPQFEDALKQAMTDARERPGLAGAPQQCCLAVAGPPHLETVSFTNSPWRFDRSLLQEHTGATDIRIINDFAAVARALPALKPKHLEQIGTGQPVAGAPRVALGPGTGLGVAALVECAHGTPTVISGEGGHVDFAPVTDVEAAVLKRLRARFGRVSIERLCCGDGMVNTYQALAEYRELPAVHTTPAAIGDAATGREDPLALETMAMFFAILGASAGNLALTFGALGGVYVAGGIAPRYIEALRRSDFRARFLAKGRYADYLATIPTYVVTHDNIGLLGAALTLQD